MVNFYSKLLGFINDCMKNNVFIFPAIFRIMKLQKLYFLHKSIEDKNNISRTRNQKKKKKDYITIIIGDFYSQILITT